MITKFSCVLFLALLSTQLTFAQTNEEFAKALFLIDVADHTKLPVTPAGEYTITVVGDPEVYNVLRIHMQKRHVDGLPLKFLHATEITDVTPSQMVFVSKKSGSQLGKVLTKINDQATMVICDLPEAVREGADFSFVHATNNNLRLDINRESIKRKNIKLSKALDEILYTSERK